MINDWRRSVTAGQPKRRRGFASMLPERQREIASKGGRIAHEKGAAHEWTVDEARSAGRKGGYARHDRRDGPTLAARLDTMEMTGQWPEA
jgi:general stress protein YciG